MRKTYEAALKRCLHDRIVQERKKNKITQEKMAELLIMDPRSYADIENGKNMCSTLTFAMYLLHFCDDPSQLISEMEKTFASITEEHNGQK
ncbi:MAG: helix-turn-helix transcriptional regulator [Clostridia bacterium]|nr:helix-turn-helix transcriptional regulator [Clostridia bacterium]